MISQVCCSKRPFGSRALIKKCKITRVTGSRAISQDIDRRVLTAAWDGFRIAGMTRRKHIVLYDSDCPLCTFQMKLITWLDWFSKVTLLPINDPRAAELASGLSREDLLEAIHCVTRDGVIYRGARAIRFLGMRMPLLVPLSLFLWLPGVIWIAEKVYMWISRNRLVLSRLFGCKGACAIMPERKQDRDF
jgi:predicted DCC family thiol-disulfide oxidoreductase YuxK